MLPRPSFMLTLQILIDGFAISALYALGATGFTLIFGVSGVLNLSHGAIMVLAAVAAWAAASVFHIGPYAGALIGVAVALVSAFVTYFAVVQPIQKSRANSQRGKGNLCPHRHPAVGDHDPGIDRVFLHQ